MNVCFKVITVRLDRFEEALRIGERISLQDDIAALVEHYANIIFVCRSTPQ